MTPEQLRKKVADDSEPVCFQGEDMRLRKISARGGLELAKVIGGMEVNELNQPANPVDMATFYAFALSKSLAMPSGELPFDSDEGRLALEELLTLEELVPLAEKAMLISGMAGDPQEAKKNLTETNCSSPNFAEPSESSTPTT